MIGKESIHTTNESKWVALQNFLIWMKSSIYFELQNALKIFCFWQAGPVMSFQISIHSFKLRNPVLILEHSYGRDHKAKWEWTTAHSYSFALCLWSPNERNNVNETVYQ